MDKSLHYLVVMSNFRGLQRVFFYAQNGFGRGVTLQNALFCKGITYGVLCCVPLIIHHNNTTILTNPATFSGALRTVP
jgi:hypothetical protein